MDTKTCTKCGETKPLDSFSPSKLGRFGVASKCKPCCARRSLALYHKNAAQTNADRRNARREDPQRAKRESAYTAKSRNRSPESRARFLERQKAWNEAHRDEINERRRVLHEQQRESDRRQALAWYHANKHRPEVKSRRLAQNALRRAKTRGAEARPIDRRSVWERDGGRCHFCRKRVTLAEMHLDHLVPLARGGAHTSENVRVSCPRCNLRSGAGRLPAQLLLIG